jgi:hypothetical protein
MAFEDDDARSDGGGEPAPAAGTTPNFSLEDVSRVVGDSIRGAIRDVAAEMKPRAQRPAEEPEPEGPSPDDDQNTAVAKAVAKALHPLKKQMADFRNFGLERLAGLTETQMRTALPYYTLYEGEIKAELTNLDPALRTDPATIRYIHDNIAMRHEPERIEKARKEGAAQARGDAPAPSGTNSRAASRNAPTNEVPTPDDLFDVGQVDEINRRGGPDSFAQRISNGRFANWEAYAKSKTTADKSRGGRGNVIPFARLEKPKKGETNAA